MSVSNSFAHSFQSNQSSASTAGSETPTPRIYPSGNGRHFAADANGNVVILTLPNWRDSVQVSESLLSLVSDVFRAMLSSPWSETQVRSDAFKHIKLHFSFEAVAWLMSRFHYTPSAKYAEFNLDDITPAVLEQVFIIVDMYNLDVIQVRLDRELEGYCARLLENFHVPLNVEEKEGTREWLNFIADKELVELAFTWLTIGALKRDDKIINRALPAIVLGADTQNAKGYLGYSSADRVVSDHVPFQVAKRLQTFRSNILSEIYASITAETNRIYELKVEGLCSCEQHSNGRSGHGPMSPGDQCHSASHSLCETVNTARLSRITGLGRYATLEDALSKLSVAGLYELMCTVAKDSGSSSSKPPHANWAAECDAVGRIVERADEVLLRFVDDDEEDERRVEYFGLGGNVKRKRRDEDMGGL